MTRDTPALTGLAQDWRKLLFPQADDAQFADGYAQAVTFGLLVARARDISLADGTEEAAQELRKSNSLIGTALRLLTEDPSNQKALETSLKTLTRVLDAVNWHTISKDKPEAWLYFYEDFLEVYDNTLRKRTGSYYTPPEVVSAMVNLVDEALRGPLFERPTGFAAPDVVVADPAVGTGTFLLGVLRKIAANLGGRFYTTPEEVRLKAEKALRECRVADLYQVSTGGKEKQPTFAWQRNAEAIAAAEALDGFYVLMANLPADPYDPSALLQLYKGQAKVERRFGNLKGPLGVSPLLFKNNERLAALVFVTYLALLVFSLIEREARKAAEPTGGKVRGYYPENREVRPTGANLLQVFRWLAVAVATGPNGPSPLPPALNQGQQLVHQLLDVPHPFST